MSNCIEMRVWRTQVFGSKGIVPLETLREIVCLGDKFMTMLRN